MPTKGPRSGDTVISVPTKILAEMRKHKGVNWSRIAVAAFAAVLVNADVPEMLVEIDRLNKLLAKIENLATERKVQGA